MLESIKTWIVTVLIGAFIVNIVDMILPSSKIKPYINLVVNFIFVFIILTPIANFFSKDMSLEEILCSLFLTALFQLLQDLHWRAVDPDFPAY